MSNIDEHRNPAPTPEGQKAFVIVIAKEHSIDYDGGANVMA
jgi:hypothetical protein